jgi:O-antigen ligase
MSKITLFFGCLLGLASWLAPNHYLPWLSFHEELLMGVALLLVLVGELCSGAGQPRLTVLLGTTLLAMCIPPIQAGFGLISFAGDAWVVFEYLLAFALAQVLGQLLAQRVGLNSLFERLSALFVAGSIACVGLQLIQWLRLPGLGIFSIDLAPGHSPYANIAQPNHLASMLFLGVVGVLFLYERGRLQRASGALTYALLAFGLVMTGSRTAWLNMALATAVLAFISQRLSMRAGRTTIVAAAVVFLGFLLTWSALNDLLMLSPGRSFATQAQVGPRPLLWATTLHGISLQPWFGFGWSQGLVMQSRVVELFPANGRLIGSSHNLILDLAMWNGVPVALGLSLILGWWFWRQLRVTRTPAHACVLLAMAGVFVHAMLEYPLSYAYFLLPIGLLMGSLEAVAPVGASRRWPRPLSWLLTFVASVLLVMIVYEYVEVETNTRTLQLELARVGTHRVTSEAPNLRLLTQWDAYLHLARIEPRPQMSPGELAFVDKAVERFPYAHVQLTAAAAHGLSGDPESARRMLVKLCSLHTRRNCMEQLGEWKELTKIHPQLKQIVVPEIPTAERP